MSDEIFLTDCEVDALLRFRPGRAARLARAGKLPALILPDGSIRFERDSLTAFLAANSTGPKPAPDGRSAGNDSASSAGTTNG